MKTFWLKGKRNPNPEEINNMVEFEAEKSICRMQLPDKFCYLFQYSERTSVK